MTAITCRLVVLHLLGVLAHIRSVFGLLPSDLSPFPSAMYMMHPHLCLLLMRSYSEVNGTDLCFVALLRCRQQHRGSLLDLNACKAAFK